MVYFGAEGKLIERPAGSAASLWAMLDEAGAEAGTISPENACGAAFVGQSGGFTQSLGSRVLIGTQMPSGAVHPITPLGLLVRLVRNRPLATHECG